MKPGQPQGLGQQIRSDIERHIASGEWPPGQRIPFEAKAWQELAERVSAEGDLQTGIAKFKQLENGKALGDLSASSEIKFVYPDGKVNAIKMDNLMWNHVSDLKGWGNAVATQFQVRSIPQNLLVDPQGRIIAKNLRGAVLEKKLDALLK